MKHILPSFQFFILPIAFFILPLSSVKCEAQNDTTKAWVEIDGDYQHLVVDTPAIFKGGDTAFLNNYFEVLNYPAEARENGDEGDVIYTFEVTEEGEVENISLIQSVTHELDSAVKASLIIIAKGKVFNPAVYKGKTVRSRIKLPIKFELQ